MLQAVGSVAVQGETRTTPIVFSNVSDPVASGLVPGLDRPSWNITGFCRFGRPCPPCPVATISATTAIVKGSVAPPASELALVGNRHRLEVDVVANATAPAS